MNTKDKIKELIRKESDALKEIAERINQEIGQVIDDICNCSGKIVVTGMGKTGLIARKISASLASTGTHSIYLHPGEAIHGDLGMVQKGDLIIMISNSGETQELLELIPYFRNHNNRIILLTGNLDSSLAREANILLDIGVPCEYEPLGLVPTVSTTTALAMGNAIVTLVLESKNFRKEDFALRHPGGYIGKRLLLKVKDVMHSGSENPLVSENVSLKKAIMEITSKNLGCVNIINSKNKLAGIITDGDLRRIFQSYENPLSQKVKKLMTKDPVRINKNISGIGALEIMEKHAITMLPVTNKADKPIATLHMHDLIKAGLVIENKK